MPDGYFGSLPIPYNVRQDPNALAEEISQLDANKASKTTKINGKSLAEDRVIYAQDIPSKNLLPNTASTQTINGITYTVNTDGTITANGTATIDSEFTVELPSNANTLQTGNYILSGCASGGSNTTYYALLWDRTTSARAKAWDGTTASGNDVGDGVGVQVVQGHAIAWDLIIKSGQTVNNLTFRPMIRLASIEDAEYVPYSKTNAELTSFTTMFKRFNMDITFNSGAAQIPLATFGFSSDWNVQITHRYKSGSNAGYSFSTQFNGNYFVLYAREADGSLPANGKVLNVDILATHF